MKRLVFFVIFLLLLLQPSQSRQRSDEEMISLAAACLENSYETKSPSWGEALPLMVLERQKGLTVIGAKSGGFVLIANDDRFNAVIGYSNTQFSQGANEAFDWYLKVINENLNTNDFIVSAVPSSCKTSVEPLITTHWNQYAPYNDKCPIYTGKGGKKERSVTGCVATALAQVLNFYKQPIHGDGTYSYIMTHGDGHTSEIDFDFENTNFDWNNMLDEYKDIYGNGYYSHSQKPSFTEVQSNAVATLMLACGIAAKAHYTSDVTSASIYDATPSYFGYKSIGIPKENVSELIWTNFIYGRLSDNFPLLLSGNDGSAGHMFILDGYDSSGLVHINWGWGGSKDGYFDINAMGYDWSQHVIWIYPESQASDLYVVASKGNGSFSKIVQEQNSGLFPCLKIAGKLYKKDITALNNFGAYNLDLSEASISGDSIPDEFFASTDFFSIILPSNTKEIGSKAFYACTGLIEVMIPNSVTTIGEWTFSHCTRLSSIEIPKSVTTIGKYAFSCCPSLPVVNNIRYAGSCAVEATDRSLSAYNIKDGTKFIAYGAFSDCAEMTSITIPKSVMSIGAWAFGQCPKLTSVILPNSIANIGDETFYYCTGLTSISIPNNVTSIGNMAFYNCTNLRSVTISNSVTTIGNMAFQSCTTLKSLVIPNSVASIGVQAFSSCSGLTSVIIGKSVTSIGRHAFSGCTGLTSIIFTNSKTEVGDYAFRNCPDLVAIVPYGTKNKFNNKKYGFKDIIELHEHQEDVNGDEKTNTADVVAVYSHIINGNESGIMNYFVDANLDGNINTADVVAIYTAIINGGDSESNRYLRNNYLLDDTEE